MIRHGEEDWLGRYGCMDETGTKSGKERGKRMRKRRWREAGGLREVGEMTVFLVINRSTLFSTAVPFFFAQNIQPKYQG